MAARNSFFIFFQKSWLKDLPFISALIAADISEYLIKPECITITTHFFFIKNHHQCHQAKLFKAETLNFYQELLGLKPFKIKQKHLFSEQKSCDSEVMSELTSASGLSHLESFKIEPQLDVFQLQDGMYRLYNKTPSAQPFILLRVLNYNWLQLVTFGLIT